MRSIGDLASFMLSSRFQTALGDGANTAAQEATTGLAKNKARHLGGATMAVSLLDRKAVLVEQHQRGIAEAAIFGGTTQSVLARIQEQSEQLVGSLSLVSQLETRSEAKMLSDNGAEVFVDTVNVLNAQVAGRYLFSGSATNSQPLPPGSELLAMLRLDASGAASAQDVALVVDAWFDDPGGPFETAYGGSETGFMSLPLSTVQSATFGLRADDDAIRDALKGLAKSALAADPGSGLSVTEQKLLLEDARTELNMANGRLIEERSSLGLTEAAIEKARQSSEAELSRLASDRLALVGIDQFEAASEFEAAQQQLDVFYRVAARQGRTSLAEYLR